MAHANNCTGYYDAYPNLLLMDFVNIGDGLQAVDIMNGVAYNATSNSTTMTSGANSQSSMMPLVIRSLAMLLGVAASFS